MLKPCQDEYFINFSSYADMFSYHETQAKNSRWERAEVNSLEVLPLDKNSPLYSAPLTFAPSVSEDAVLDTAGNLGLAISLHGEYYPLRATSYKSLLDRAKIGGTALPKLKRSDLADMLNACLRLHKAEALLLIRDEKISAAHSGDAQDYSVLPIDELLDIIRTKLDERFPGHTFDSGYSDHSITSAAFSMPAQKDDLLSSYSKILESHGKKPMAEKLMPGIRFSTSDIGIASAKVSAILIGLPYPIHIGGMADVEHRAQAKPDDFGEAISMMFAQFESAVLKLEKLASVYLDHPVNAMTAICKKLALPKKAALEAICMFEFSYGGGNATAHDVFIAMQEIMFILKTQGTPESKLLSVEESLARALLLNWQQYDYAKAVSY